MFLPKSCSTIAARVAALATLAAAVASAKDFDFKDPKGVNSITFVLDSTCEPISGTGAGISGKAAFDPAKPESFSGKISLDARTLTTPNAKMKEVLHSADWLDVEKYASVDFDFKKVKAAKSVGENVWELEVVGDLTIRGVTKEQTIKVRASHLPGKLGDRMPGGKGDLLVLRSEFTIKRADFGIKPDAPTSVVAEEIQLRVGIVGAAPNP